MPFDRDITVGEYFDMMSTFDSLDLYLPLHGLVSAVDLARLEEFAERSEDASPTVAPGDEDDAL